MLLNKLAPYEGNIIHAIIETPRGSQHKYNYDPELQLFRLKKILPLGAVFPFDFGFIPNTKGEDGDPLDILVIMDQAVYPGCLVDCRPIAVLEAKQKEGNKKEIRNDRIIAVAISAVMFADMKKLSESMMSEIEHFFINYNKQEGKKFIPLHWASAKEAIKLIDASR